MITPDELYMYALTEDDRINIVNLLSSNSYYITWDQRIVNNTEGLTYLEETGLWYNSSQLKICDHCGKQYLVHDTPRSRSFHSSHHDREVNYCSEVCVKDSNHVVLNNGDIIYDITMGQRMKGHYKSSTQVTDTTDEHPFLIGIEIEKEDQDSYDKMYLSDTGLASPNGWLYVHDGSLRGDCGLELVSPGYNLTRDKKEMIEAINVCSDFINGDSSSRCGGHISVSEKNKTSEQLAKELLPLISFMLTLFPNRMQNSKINKMTFMDCLINRQDKYKPLMLGDNGRVELRMISRVKSVKCLKRRIEIIEWFLLNKPTFKQTKQSMQNGYLKDVMSAVYGTETWDEKIKTFKTMSLWYCWNVNSSDIDTIIANDS